MIGIRLGLVLSALSLMVFVASAGAVEIVDVDFAAERIATLIGQLDHRNVRLRGDAIKALHELGPEARVAVPKLIELLADEEWFESFLMRTFIHGMASDALIAIGGETVGPLIDRFPLLPDKAQRRATYVAQRIGNAARGLLPEIQKRMQSSRDDQRWCLLGPLAAIDPTGQAALPILLRSLREGHDSSERREAAEWLTRSESLEIVYWKEYAPASGWFSRPSPGADAVADALILALKDPSPEVRGPAAVSLSTYPEAAKRAVPALIALLSDQEIYDVMWSNHTGGYRTVNGDAVLALSRLHEAADESLAALLKKLRLDPEFANVERLAFAIADLAPHSKHPAKYLNELLESQHPELAIIPLARAGKESHAAIPKLQALAENVQAEWIRDDARCAIAVVDPDGQPEAIKFIRGKLEGEVDPGTCRFLAAVGQPALFAVPVLRKQLLLQGSRDHLNHDVMSVLAAIGLDAVSAAPQIIDSLDSQYSFYLDDCEAALRRFGPGVVPMLVDALRNPGKSPLTRISCLRVLESLGPKASDAVPVIIKQLDSEYPRVREAASKALGMIGSRPDESLPALDRLLLDRRSLVRAAAANSCGRFGLHAKPVVPQLINALSDDYLDVRTSAAFALGQLGALAAEATPQLTELSRSQNVLLRECASGALQKIRQPGTSDVPR